MDVGFKCQKPFVYRSVSGFTKKYAEWIAEELKADLFDARKIDPPKLQDYELIIFGGSLHAAGINGLKLIKDNPSLLAEKKIVVFAVGASMAKANVVEEIRKRNFGEEPLVNLKLFYLRGGFNFGKLDFTNKVLMSFFRLA